MHSRLRTTVLNLIGGFVIGTLAFGGPLTDAFPLLSSPTPVVHAAAADYPGQYNLANPADAVCAPVVSPGASGVAGLGICTDAGQAEAVASKIKRNIDYQLTFAAYLGVLNAATFFAQTVAYDTAEWMASGFKGQAPGIYTDPFGTYTRNLLLDSVGEFMGTFSKNFTEGTLGLNLCRPPNFPQLALEFALQLPDLTLGAKRPVSSCPWTTLVQNWDRAASSLDNPDALLAIRDNFTVGGNDLSFGIGAHLAFFNFVSERQFTGIQERLLGNGYKDVTNFISGTIETPAQTVQRNIDAQLIENPSQAQNMRTSALLGNAFELGWVQLGVVTASTFTNVLLSRLLQKVTKGLVKTSGGGFGGFPDLLDPNAAPPGSTSPREIFASQYSDLKTPLITKSEAEDLLTDLAACPTNARNKWNCAMDQALATALRQGGGLTVRQAIDQGFLNPEWQLIPSTRLKENQDPTCSSRAFCVANLRKLRMARVVPVGWELAAESLANQQACVQADGCVTLGEVIRRFDDCAEPSVAQGGLDDAHPYCHLIDPNWVLTVFPAQCQTKGYGNQILAGTSQRLQECQDTTTCLERDANGNCVGGYGYCMAEQTFWQFDAPSCSEQYASCRTFTPRGSNAKQVSYLRSTLDYGACNAGNVGCMWYARYRDAAGANVDSAWKASASVAINMESHAVQSDRIYLDKDAVPCDASDDGCTALRRVTNGGSSLNLVQNGSFERTETRKDLQNTDYTALTAWYGTAFGEDGYTAPQPGSGSASVDGAQALLVQPSATFQWINQISRLSLRPSRQYVLSFYARRNTTAPQGANVVMHLQSASGGSVANTDQRYYRSNGCTFQNSANRYALAGVAIPSNLGDEWTRFTCSFLTTPDTENGTVNIQNPGTSSGALLIDGVQLEEGELVTPFVDGLNASLASLNMKVPPDELACTGDARTDHALCANFARVCRQTEAGCQGYRPKGDGTAPEIPAVLTAADTCPAECVGYAEFRKQASTFDLVRSPDTRLDDPEDDTIAAFIPSTGRSCAAQDVGCELFTNLDAPTQGGEAQSAFNELRLCEKPGPDSQTYYTWEGSDTTGYQLKTWSLKRDTNAPLPQGPRVFAKAGTDGTIKEPDSCNQTSYLQALDPDCRQFYDPQGAVFYRFESQTILSSEACRSYRKDGSNRADCEKTGGVFNQATAQCVYGAHPEESRQCDAVVAGCRAYIGTQGRAQEQTFAEDFTSDDHSAYGTSGVTLALSDEAVLVGDKSIRVDTPNNNRVMWVGKQGHELNLLPGGLYELRFWAKTPTAGGVTVTVNSLKSSANSDDYRWGAVIIGTNWQEYRIGPFQVEGDAADTRLHFRMNAGNIFFFDKIRVERIQDISYVVKNSWNTPASCDRTPEGTPSVQAMLGCRAYTDRRGTQVNVRQFTRLCREDVIGCTAYVNTRNTTSPDPVVNQPGTPGSGELRNPWVAVLGDRYDYYVEDASKLCKDEAVSCRAFGKPLYRQDRLALDSPAFTTVYFKNDPENYDDMLCSEQELFCESYTYSTDHESGTAYFRAPGSHACEYRTAAVVPNGAVPGLDTSGTTYDGWFRVGTDQPCYPDLLKSGNLFDIRYSGDPGYNGWNGSGTSDYPTGQTYQGWTGTCPAAQAECTEFRDVNDTSDIAHPSGRPYFVVDNSRMDRASCGGQVDPGRGCVLFADTSQPRMTFNVAATLHLYQTRAYQPVGPVDCETGNHPSCAAVNATTNDANTVVRVKPDRSCSEWLACTTAETVYDPQTNQYKSVCSSLALCNDAGQAEGDGVPFCSNYVDRSVVNADGSLNKDTLLAQNVVLTSRLYATRRTGFGAKDYTGATLPNQLQVLDAKSVPVASMLSLDPAVQSRYKRDYRLAVPIPLWSTYDGPSLGVGMSAIVNVLAYARPAPNDTVLAGSDSSLVPYACKFGDAYGLMTDGSNKLATEAQGATVCWVSMDQTPPPQLGVGGAPLVSDGLNMLNLIRRLSQTDVAELDSVLTRSLPPSQCKAAPEADAPFSNAYVLEWDDTVDPPQPMRAVEGYGQMNFCEYGEECACTYKRVEYGGPARFYEPLSTNVANAVCIGGVRDGQPCALDVGIQGSAPVGGEVNRTDTEGNQVTIPVAVREQPHADYGCGTGGVCSAIKDVKLVRGGVGQCLQYDLSRTVAGDSSRAECLLWNPNPAFAGPSDPYHWIPTAGFQPPQSSGRYYCTAPYREPRVLSFRPQVTVASTNGAVDVGSQVGFSKNSTNAFYAGQIATFWYDDAITSDESCSFLDIGGCDGDEPGGSLDGVRSGNTHVGLLCENADEDQNPSSDYSSVRLVTTGRGVARSYAEYAVLFDKDQVGKVIAGHSPTAQGVDPEVIRESTMEDSVSSFLFTVMGGKLACAYTDNWVPGAEGADYDDPGSWQPKDATWHAGFKEELARGGGRLDRRNARIVTEDGSDTGVPVKVDCRNPENGDDGCFIKTWTLDYRAEGQSKHRAFGADSLRDSMDSLSKSPIYGKCDSDHSWFSINAVFEDSEPDENAQNPNDINPKTLVGPFQLVGLWITACAPGEGPSYIYMRVDMSTADVCRELAETISKDSHESAAFTDRNWSRGTFVMPRSGFTWDARNIPFGASLATRDAGEDPLYMSGVKQANSNPLHPPAFTYPGQTYFRAEEYPTSNWGLLSNVFARIYRIYGYNSRQVSRTDWACTDPLSPNFGQWCPDLGDVDVAKKMELSRQYCGYEAKCVKTGIESSGLFAQKACNAFSGVNRGLDCTADPNICHLGPVQRDQDGVPRTQYDSCNVFKGWTKDSGGRWHCTAETCTTLSTSGEDCAAACGTERGCTQSQAVRCGVFRCAGARSPEHVGSSGSYCTAPTDEEDADGSTECPAYVEPGSVACINIDPVTNRGKCEGYPWAQCGPSAYDPTGSSDCHFIAQNYWPKGEVNNTYKWWRPMDGYPKMDAGDWYTQGSNVAVVFGSRYQNMESTNPSFGYLFSSDYRLPHLDETCNESWEDPECRLSNAFSPAVPWQAPEATLFYAHQASIANGVLGSYSAGEHLFSLYPGASPFAYQSVLNPNYVFVERRTFGTGYRVWTLDGTSVKLTTSAPLAVLKASEPPYVEIIKFPSADICSSETTLNFCGNGALTTLNAVNVHWGACEPVALMYQDGGGSGHLGTGTCRGGARGGATCEEDTDCLPQQLRDDPGLRATRAVQSMSWCNPVTSGEPSFSVTAPSGPLAGQKGNEACWQDAGAYAADNPRHPIREEDPALDSNICTRPSGYWPRPNVCNDPNDEYCGLFGYFLGSEATRNMTVNDSQPLPTDVTPGLYTPPFLNQSADANLSDNPDDYNYVRYYTPIPPQVAAPDMRACQGGSCRITQLGTIGVDGIGEGTVNGGAGSHVAALRFYAWASHEQMPLRKLAIDWGDGTKTELPDAFLKNHKPFCQTDKECSLSPGLTCQSDSDCPAGGGQCISFGTCQRDPSKRCSSDSECDSSEGDDGICNPRVFFGNDQDACEEQYFEFRHAYSCSPESEDALPACRPPVPIPTPFGMLYSMACSSNPNQGCLNDAGCPAGDRCIATTAERGGCFDTRTKACKFTPKLVLEDNWGWTTGECRTRVSPNGSLTDAPSTAVLHPNGGCYVNEQTKANFDRALPVSIESILLQASEGENVANVRPWIVFPGSIQVRSGEVQ